MVRFIAAIGAIVLLGGCEQPAGQTQACKPDRSDSWHSDPDECGSYDWNGDGVEEVRFGPAQGCRSGDCGNAWATYDVDRWGFRGGAQVPDCGTAGPYGLQVGCVYMIVNELTECTPIEVPMLQQCR